MQRCISYKIRKTPKHTILEVFFIKKEESQKQGKEQSQDKDGFMKAFGEPLPFR